MNKRDILVGSLSALLGYWLSYATVVPPTILVIKEIVPVNVYRSGPTVYLEQEPTSTVYLEREPTPHPTDCVAMRWLE